MKRSLLLGALLAASSAQARWVEVLSSLHKVRPADRVHGAGAAHLTVARGECEAFQLYVRPPRQQVSLSVPSLKGPAGATLEVRPYRQGWITLHTASNSEGATGPWPDALIPAVDAYAGERRSAFPFDSTAERPLLAYLEVCVPHAQRPGAYRGTATVVSTAGRASVPVRVDVEPFALPATSSLVTSFGISQYAVARGHGLSQEDPRARALLRTYALALLSHRLSPHGMSMSGPAVIRRDGQLTFDFTAYDEEMAALLDGTALPSGARVTSADLREAPRALGEEDRVAYYRAFREHFAARGWKAQLFFYAKDEPTPKDYPLVREQAARLRRAGGVPVLVTTPDTEGLAGTFDILAPVLNCFFRRPGPETCARPPRDVQGWRADARQVWWYQSCMSHGCNGGPLPDPKLERAFTGWASYMVDHPITSHRAMGPLAFAAGVDGELYFDTVHALALEGRDPWADVFAFGGNGDGTLFYPGTPDRIGGTTPIPIESLRLKAIRDGLEDYEYLRLYRDQTSPRAAQALARRLARSGYEIARDVRVWQAVRAQLAARLRTTAPKYAGPPPVTP